MVDAISDEALLRTYQGMPTVHLKRAAVGFALDLADRHKQGPELVAFCERRLAVIRQVLEARGETMPTDGLLP